MGSYQLVHSLLVYTIISVVVTNIHETDALVFDPQIVNSYGSQYYRILHVDENFALIGGRNRYYNMSTTTLQVQQSYPWNPSDGDIEFCNQEIIKFDGDCDSYVVTAVKQSDDLYHICASSAKRPVCRLFRRDAEGKWPLATDVVVATPPPLVPIFPWLEVRKLVTDSGALHVAGHSLQSGSVWCPKFYRDNTYNADGSVKKTGLRSECSDALVNVDYKAQKAPQYSNVFETDDFVYFTFSEPALETISSVSTQSTVYSRIARVCKNDAGRGPSFLSDPDSSFKFATLFKARLLCGVPGVSEPLSDLYLRQEYSGYYDNYIDEIADASVRHMSSMKGADGEDIIYAIFNSAPNSIKTSAICAYKVSDINRIFDNTDKVVEFVSEFTATPYTASRPAAKCYGDGVTPTAATGDAIGKYLLFDPVKPLGDNALFMSAVDYRMTQMQVDWQVEAGDAKNYDVLFVSTDDGRVLKFVNFAYPGKSSGYHLVEERDVFPGQKIHEMRLIKVEGDKKHLLVNTLDQIKRISIEKCHMYEDCASCIGLRDPYCYWSPSLSKCVSTTHIATDKVQNMSSGVSSQCGGQQFTSSSTVDLETKTSPPENVVVKTGQSKTGPGAESKPTAWIALAIILPVIVGGAAFVGGYCYGMKKYKSPTPHIDEELTNKCKDEAMKSDAYQTLPKPSNLQYTNNLSGKTYENSTSTLTRHKQAYV